VIAWRSLEIRLTAWYSAMLFLGYVIFGIALWLTVRYAVGAAVDDLLVDRVLRLVTVVSEDADGPEEVEEDLVEYITALPESHLAQLRDERGAHLFPSDGAEAPIPWEATEGRVFQTVLSEGMPYRVLTQSISVLGRSYGILLASSLQSLVIVRHRLASSLLVAAPFALLLCSGGGFYIARRALKPLDRIAEAARGITVGSLSKRMDVPATGDSLEKLALTFNEMLSRLESSVDRIEQFSADASHELRTPLSLIRTTAELALRHGRTEDEYRADLRNIHEEAKRMSELIEVLLALSREGVDGAAVAMSRVDLVRLASEVCRPFRRAAEEKSLTLRLDAPSSPVMVTGNDPSLRRMIASLLENALAHTVAGGVTVSVHEGDGPELSVRDTGEGVAAEALPRIFDRFYRVDASRSRATGGHGLGLSIARRIAELHDAELTVESRLAEGSRFTVRFSTRA
jgi:heavy metal sensor kinase